MMNKYLVLKGCAGLGNRFITLMKAINYAKKTNRSLYVDWSDGMFGAQGVNIFYKYFNIKNIPLETSLELILKEFEEGTSTFPENLTITDLQEPIYTERNAQGNFFVFTPWISNFTLYKVALSVLPVHKLGCFLGLQSFQRINKKEHFNWYKSIRTINDGNCFPLGSTLWPWINKNIVVFADFRPLVQMKHFFDYVSLNKIYIDKINKIASDLGIINAVGVHIRYTDKKPSKKLNKLYEELDRVTRKDKRVFLCSDNEDIVNDFKLRYNDKLIIYDKFIPKVDDGGIHIWAAQNNDGALKQRMFEDSIIEMWLLSMTEKLYWQGNSSFSFISSLLINDKSRVQDWMKL